MKVYVSELPKSCERCPFHDTKYGRCDISGSRVEYFGCHSLTPLSDYTKQVRKEVCEKFVEQFMIEYTMGNDPVEDIIYNVSERIQGEYND